MTPKSIFKLFSLKGIGQTMILRQVSMLVICVAVLSLFALTTYAQEPTNDSGVELSGLAVAPAAVTDKESASDSAYLAANPELLKVRPPVEVQEMADAEFLAANPELMVARRYTDAIENESSQPAPYDIEAVHAQSYTSFREKNTLDSTFLAANPELSSARRYASITE